MRQRHVEPDAEGRQRGDPGGPRRAAPPQSCCRSRRPGRPASTTAQRPLAQALKGVFLNACTIALDARENTMDAAGSLIEIWRDGRHQRERRATAPSIYDPLGVLAKTGTLYYPAGSLVRDRRQARRRLPHHVARDGAARRRPCPTTRPAPARRRSWPPCWRRWSPTCAPARRRGSGRAWRSARSRSALAADADLFLTMAKLRAARASG